MLYIRVNVDEDIENTRLYSSSTDFSLEPWSSNVDTFLQIYAPKELESVNCDDSLNLDIKLKTLDAPKGNLYFQVQSQSGILFAGSFNLETNEKSANIDENIFETENVKINKFEDQIENKATDSSSIVTTISISILVDAKMSPEFTFLAYYTSSGEVIPDSIMIPVKKCLKNKVNSWSIDSQNSNFIFVKG